MRYNLEYTKKCAPHCRTHKKTGMFSTQPAALSGQSLQSVMLKNSPVQAENGGEEPLLGNHHVVSGAALCGESRAAQREMSESRCRAHKDSVCWQNSLGSLECLCCFSVKTAGAFLKLTLRMLRSATGLWAPSLPITEVCSGKDKEEFLGGSNSCGVARVPVFCRHACTAAGLAASRLMLACATLYMGTGA